MKKILIIGGYGAVGSTISKHLAQHYPNKIIVAGRNIQAAEKLAQKLNQTVIPLELDLSGTYNPEILDEVGLVIMCLDQQDTQFVEHCISKGIHYIDITANQELIHKMELLDPKAKANNASITLSVGLAPGITNLLAQHSINQSPQSEWIDIFILLGLGEKHGDAAYRWTFDNLHKTYPVSTGQETKFLKSFTFPKQTALSGKRKFYLFDFSDQHTLTKTTAIKKVLTRMAFDSKFLTGSIALMRKTGLTKVFRNKKVQNFLIPLFKKSAIGSDIFAVKIATGNDLQSSEYSLKGNGEGKITAYVAVQMALYTLQHPVKPGVLHIHQVIENIPDFLQGLKTYDPNLELKL